MEPIQTNVPIFGQEKKAFIRIVKYYNDIKVGYDAAIAAYGEGYAVVLPDGGNVPVRHKRSLPDLMMNLQELPQEAGEALGFEFETPLRKGYRTNIDATLSSWDETEILASARLEEVFFETPEHKSPEVLDVGDNDPYGYVRILLNKHLEDDLENAGNFLQAKIQRWFDKGMPITNRLFILRVKQIVWPIPKDFAFVKTEDFECRDDSIILEFMEQEPQ